MAVTSAPVVTGLTTSTSFMIGAGLKKCIPTTSWGRLVTAAISTTGSEEVVVARMAPCLQIRSRSRNNSSFTSRLSTIASTTRSTSARASRSVAPVIRASTSSRTSSVILALLTARSSDFWTAARTPATFSSLRATKTTS